MTQPKDGEGAEALLPSAIESSANASPSAALHGANTDSEPSARVQIGPRFVDDFNGDTARLLDSIDALLRLHATGGLSHPIPGLARQLLNNAAARLEAEDGMMASFRAPPATPVRGGGQGSSNASRAAMGPSAHSAPEAEPSAAWCPIDSGVPPSGKKVWLYGELRDRDDYTCDGVMVIGYRNGGRYPASDCAPAGGQPHHIIPTHWMPLPEAPR